MFCPSGSRQVCIVSAGNASLAFGYENSAFQAVSLNVSTPD
jgi:hypothetical protein